MPEGMVLESLRHRDRISTVVDLIQGQLALKYPENILTGGYIAIETPLMSIGDIRYDFELNEFLIMAVKKIDEIIASDNFKGYELKEVGVRNILQARENPDGNYVFFRIIGVKEEK